jgi:WD40 repeat protein/Ca2+-binding EF-hand superfamily protein
MGQVLGRAVLRDEVLPFVNYQRESIYNLWESFNDVAEGFGINVDEFKEICSVLQSSLGNIRKAALERICETLFDAVLDTDHNGLIDALEMLSAITIVSGLRRKDKLTHVFNLYDFDESAEVTIDEMTLLLKSTMSGLCKFCGIAPPDERRLEMMSQTAFSAIQKDKDNALTREEFLDYCDRTPEIRSWLAHFDDAMDLCDDIKYQMDSDVDHEFDFFAGFEHGEKTFPAILADENNLASTVNGHRTLQAEQVSAKNSVLFILKLLFFSKLFFFPFKKAARNDEDSANYTTILGLHADPAPIRPWHGTLEHTVPTNPPPIDSSLPDESALQLEWVHGYFAAGTRNAVQYTVFGDIIFPAACVGAVMSSERHEQKFMMAHTSAIGCIAMHPAGKVCASGDAGGNRPTICLWDVGTCQVLCQLSGFHQKSVTSVAFSPSGRQLASIGADRYHSIAVYDWQLRRLLYTCKSKEEAVLGLIFRDEEEFMTCGVDHITFWRGTGSARRGQEGIYGKLGKRQTHLCIATLEDGRAVTGTMSGHIYVWDCRNCVKTVKAHDKSVNVIFVCKHGLITGGRDGKIRLWSATGANIEPGAVFDIGGLGSFNPRVRSVCWSSDGAKLLVGTMGSEIYEISAGDGSNFHAGPVLQGHCRHEVHGLAMSPIKPEYCTVGDDQTVRIWDLKTRALIKMVMLDTMARTCRYSPDGMLIVIGLGAKVEGVARQKKMGAYIVLDSSDLTITHEARDSKEPPTDIKFSGDGKTLAVATLDSSIYLYNVEDFTSKGRCKGHSGGCLHFDFSVDDQWLHSTCDRYEMLYWNAYTGEQHKAIGSLRDVEWTTWTCPLGWHVQGMWPKKDDPIEYACADRSGDCSVIVTGDDYGRVSLRRFPCVESSAAAKHHYGHSAPIKNVGFSPGDRYVISVGGADRCVFQWKHVADDAEDEAEEFTKDLDSEDEADYLDGDLWDRPVVVSRVNEENMRQLMELEEKQDADAKADDFRPVKPWEGSIVGPTNPPRDDPTLPEERLELEWIHGLRCDDVRENVRYTNNGSIAYFAGKMAIVFNKDGGGLQRYYSGHVDSILSLAIHEDGQIVATGDLGKIPSIHVWDCSSLVTQVVLKGLHTRGVNLLRFGGGSGERLVSCGLGMYHKVGVWDWQNNLLLASFAGGLQKVLCVDLTPDGYGVVQCGVKHIKFHSLQGRNVVSQRGLIGRKGKVQTMLCIGWTGSRPVIGTQDGCLYCFEGRRLIQKVLAHESSVNCLYACSEGLVSGGKDGKVKVWSSTLECKREISMVELGCVRPSVRSVHWNSDDNRLLIAARSAEIFELSSVNGNNLNKGPIVQGHFAFEVWGLAMHPIRKEFVTVGDDQTVRVWSIAHRRVLRQTRLDTIGRAIAYDPSGTKIVVGLGGRVGRGRQKKDGAFVVLDEVDLKIVHEARDAKQWISDVKFSPDHNSLAIASHDNNLYVYDVPNAFELRAVMDKHNSFIHSIDFSKDSQYIQSVCGAYEFIISDANTGTHVPAISTLKDVRWDTWTCNLGWPVQGLWPKHSEGTDVRTVDRSHYGSLVVTGDGFGHMKLRRYPCINKTAAARVYKGHGQRINRVRFTPEDDYVVSVGGEDRSIFQWRVIPSALDDAMKADESGQDSDLDVEGFFDVDDDDAEEFMAIKPWVGTIVPPTVAPIASSTPPAIRLELEHVYGRRAQDVRNNMFYATDGQVV